jgi:nucleotide-binding universal stress UspA family protein
MDAIRKILVPTDFSAYADEAFRVAQTLARAVGAEVILFHVAHTPAVVSEGGKLLANPGKVDAENLWDRFHSAQPADARVRVEHQVIMADRPSAGHVLEILDKLGCDLIVMGTHGHSRLKHLLFGSVTEEVVRLARCPVMVVKAPRHAAEPPTPAPAQTTKGQGTSQGRSAEVPVRK